MTGLFLCIGLAAGVTAGLFGVGGGIIIVPALTLLAGLTQERATGTSLAVLLPPVGLLAVLEYYRHGNVDLKAAAFVALGLFLGAWLGAWGGHKMGDMWLKAAFGVFMALAGIWVAVEAFKEMHGNGL